MSCIIIFLENNLPKGQGQLENEKESKTEKVSIEDGERN